MQPVKIDLPPHMRGDVWEGLARETPILFNGVAPDYDLASVRMYFRNAKNGRFGYGFNSETTVGYGPITITNAANWEFDIAEQLLPLDVGRWKWDLETVDTNGITRTLYDGVLTITQDQTYDDD